MARQILRLKEAQDVLRNYHGDLMSTIQSGFSDWLKIREFANTLPGGMLNYKARTKAGIIHDHIEKHARTSFEQKEGIAVDNFNGVFGLNIQDELFVRFKKMDSTYAVRNMHTKQHKNYMKQFQIDGFPEKPTFLFAGYIPDRSWSSIKGIYVACWIGNTLEWVDEFGKYTAEQGVINFEQSTGDVYTQIEKRIKLKKDRKAGTKKTGTDN
jgi:hypothetical protein